jgi:hypothetical protein
MSKYFESFPLLSYNFGDNENPSLFQNLTSYVDIVDGVKDDIAFYEKMTIEEYERPDTLSFKLYGTTDYYWTFFLLNDDLKRSGWPLSNRDLLIKAKTDYPNQVITTEDTINNIFLPNDNVIGLVSGSTGTVVKRYLDLGQIVISNNGNFKVDERIRSAADDFTYITSLRVTDQHLSVHHYEDANGNWIDIDPNDQIISSGTIPITYYDRMVQTNNNLKNIKILKREVAPQIAANFKRSLLG